MKIKNLYLILLAILIIVSSCNDDSDLVPITVIEDQVLQTVITLEEFQAQVIKELSGESNRGDLQSEIPSELGKLHLEAIVAFETVRKTPTGFIPVYEDASTHTEAIILATYQPEGIRYSLLKRGELYNALELKTDNPDQLNPAHIADVFISYDRAIFNLYEDNQSDIIGRNNDPNGQSSGISIESGDFGDVASEWVHTEHCYFSFTGTAEDPYQNLTGIDCYTETHWESDPSADIIIDAGSGGGGSGGSYVPNGEAYKKAEEDRISRITDPEERRKAQLEYLKRFGGQAGKDFAALIESLLATPGLKLGDVYEINKIVQDATNHLINNYFSAILGTPAKLAKPFIELALTGKLSDIGLQALSNILKSKVGVQLYESVKSLIQARNLAPRFEFMSASKKLLEYRVHTNRSGYMNFLSRETSKNWSITSSSDVFILEHNGITYTLRTQSKTWHGPTVEVFNGTGSSKVLISKLRLNP